MSDFISALESRFGKEIRLAGLCKKASTVYTIGRIQKLVGSYIDERTKEDFPVSEPSNEMGDDEYIDAIFENSAVLRENKELSHILATERVSVRGFLEKETGISVLEDPASAERIVEFWEEKTRSMKSKGTHFIFSLDPRIGAKFASLGQSSHGHLVNCVDETLSKFAKTFYPETSIGYITGFHSDRHHPHLHVLLFPRLANGKRYNISSWSLRKEDRLDYQGFIKREFNRSCWDAFLDLALLPDQRARHLELVENDPERRNANALAVFAAVEDAQGIPDRGGRPLRDFIPVAMDSFLEDPKREFIAKNLASRRQLEFLEKAESTNPDETKAQVKLERIIDLQAEAAQSFEPLRNLVSLRRERIRATCDGIRSGSKIDFEALLEARKDAGANWQDSLLKAKIGSHLALYSAASASEALHESLGILPPHLRDPDANLNFPDSSKVEQGNFTGRLRENVVIADNRKRSPVSFESIKNLKLFEADERLHQRRRAKVVTKQRERILKGLEKASAVDPDLPESEMEITAIYSKQRTVDAVKTRARTLIETPITVEPDSEIENSLGSIFEQNTSSSNSIEIELI